MKFKTLEIIFTAVSIASQRLLNALNELEKLKPEVQRQLDELNRKHGNQENRYGPTPDGSSVDDSFEWSSVKKKTNNKNIQVLVAAEGFNDHAEILNS